VTQVLAQTRFNLCDIGRRLHVTIMVTWQHRSQKA
jgi:hypothetical protein